MKTRWLSRSGGREVLLVFGGWALGPAPFEGLIGRGDVLFVDDYRMIGGPMTELAPYERVDLLAFSFGVAAAAHWVALTGVAPDRKIAVNGTLRPVDPARGIAPDLVTKTAENLSQQSFARFCRRAGLGGETPIIDIAARKAELQEITTRGPAPDIGFDRVWIAAEDRIMPATAQRAAWQETDAEIRHCAGAHVPFSAGQNWAEWIG